MLLKKNCSICNVEITGWGQAHLDRMCDIHVKQQHGIMHVVSAPVVVIEEPEVVKKTTTKKKTTKKKTVKQPTTKKTKKKSTKKTKK